MPAAPGLTFHVRRYRVWNLGVLLLGGAGCLSMGAWALQALGGLAAWGGLLAACAAVLALVRSLWRDDPVLLRWDGQCWSWGRPDAQGRARGRLQVALDLQDWLLLRLQPEAGATPGSVLWLPVERQGGAARWHALRCAVYSPTPVADDVTARESA
jgi:hypothetical protein